MTKKEMVIKALVEVGANVYATEGTKVAYTLTENQLSKLVEELAGKGFTICNNKFEATLKALYDGNKKTRYATLKIVPEEKKITVKKSSEKTGTGTTKKVSSVKIGEIRYKVTMVTNSKTWWYELWATDASGKRTRVAKDESLEVINKLLEEKAA